VRLTSGVTKGSRIQTSSIRWTIRAPRRFDVRLHSSGGGLSIRDMEGSFEGTTGGGAITLERAKGRASLSTGGGEILVNDSDLSGSVSTGGGLVRFSRVRGGLRASSGSGPVIRVEDTTDADISTGLDGVTVEGSDVRVDRARATPGRLNIERAGGHIDLDEAPYGATVSTGGGRISIGRAAGLVEARTGGGEIDIGPVAGSVHASTGAGTVHVTIADARGQAQDVDIVTGHGPVILELPASFDGRFELEAAYTDGYRGGKSHIQTDWPLPQEETQNWDSSEGTPRRYVRARGTAGSGRSLVRIKTVNGDVTVRRR